MLQADLDAQQAINEETAHIRQREAELRTLVWGLPPHQ
jgi:hypothetical protein